MFFPIVLVYLLCLFSSARAECLGKSGAAGYFQDVALDLFHTDGQQRIFSLYVPANYVATKETPLVFGFHGGGGQADGFRLSTELDKLADTQGFILVLPEGVNDLGSSSVSRTWNAGDCCGYATETGADDLTYFDLVLKNISSSYCVDNTRIYSTGHSNGAAMTYRLMCERSDIIAAAAPNSGPFSFGNFTSCATPCNPPSLVQQSCFNFGLCGDPQSFAQENFFDFFYSCKNRKRNVPFLYFQGELDSRAPINGGTGLDSFDIRTDLPVNVTLEAFRERYGCGATKTITFQNNTTPNDTVTCFSFHCDPNSNITFCIFSAEGHQWPGGPIHGGLAPCVANINSLACKALINFLKLGPFTSALSASSSAWEFFQKHSLIFPNVDPGPGVASSSVSLHSFGAIAFSFALLQLWFI